MTQEIIVWVLLMELVWLIWVMALAILADDHHSHDNRKGSASSKHSDGHEPNERSPQQARVAA